MPWWGWWLIIGLPLGGLFMWVMVSALDELNPDPGWRRREAEIRRLEQQARLRELVHEMEQGAGPVSPEGYARVFGQWSGRNRP